MLADQLNETRMELTYPDGYVHDMAVAPIRRRLADAQVIVLDRLATGMAASVALSRPSSIVSAIPWVKLPFESVWMEFSNADLRDAMTSMGSPNVRPEGGRVVIERSGFLLRMQGDVLLIEYVHSDRTDEGSRLVDIAPVRAKFSLKGDFSTPTDIEFPLDVHPEARGRIKSHISAIADNPEELAADMDLRMRYTWTSHPDLARVRSNLVGMVGETQVNNLEAMQADELYRLFSMQILPALILLNCRNAVTTDKVEVSRKLNKNRVAKGRPPLVDHLLVKMHLSPVAKRRADAAGKNADFRTSRGTLVMGHFKVRKTGVYWWSPHARRGQGGDVKKTIVLTK